MAVFEITGVRIIDGEEVEDGFVRVEARSRDEAQARAERMPIFRESTGFYIEGKQGTIQEVIKAAMGW